MGISTERVTEIHQTKRWNRRRARSYLAQHAQKGAYSVSDFNWLEHQAELGTPNRENRFFKAWSNIPTSLHYGGGEQRNSSTRSSPIIFGGGPFRAFARMCNDYDAGETSVLYVYDYDDNLWGWGANNYGHFGHGDVITRSSPVLLQGWNELGPLTRFKNTYYGTVGITTAGHLYVCGYNYYGKFGFTNTEVFTNWDIDGNYSSENTVGVTTLPATMDVSKPVRIGGKWKDVCINQSAVGRINDDGELFYSGYNHYGIFGNGLSEAFGRSIPVKIPGKFTKIVEMTHYNHFVKKDDNAIYVTGYEANSWFGRSDSGSISRSSPVVFPGNWAKIIKTYNGYTMLDDGGNVWGVGNNVYGQLGQNDIAARSRPTLVWSGPPDASSKIVDFMFTEAYGHYFLMDDDTLWAVGLNYSTQLFWTSAGIAGAAAGWYLNSYWSCHSQFLWQSLSMARSLPVFVQGGWDSMSDDEVINSCDDPYKYNRLTRADIAGFFAFHVPGTDCATDWSQHHGGPLGESDNSEWNFRNRENYTWHDDDVQFKHDLGWTP